MVSVSRRLLPSTSALAAFDAVARLGSFSAAADELSLTQGAVSRQVANLEAQLGIALFVREGRGASLTAQGRAYADAIAGALGAIRSASLAAITRTEPDTLNLAVPPTFGTRWLMPRLPGFIAMHPSITLHVATRIGRFDFAAESLDAAVYVGENGWGAEVATELLLRETVTPMCSPDFAAANGVKAPQDLARLPLLHLKSRSAAWDDWFRPHGLPRRTAGGMTFEQFSTVAQACAAGMGMALLPIFLMRGELDRRELTMPFAGSMVSRSGYFLVYPKSRAGHQPLAAFRDWIAAEARSFAEDKPA